MLNVTQTLNQGFRLQADLSQLDHNCTTAAQVHAGRLKGDFAVPRSQAACQHLKMLHETGGSRKQCQLSVAKHQFSVILLLSSPAPFSSLFLIFALSFFCFCCLNVLLESLAMATPAGEGRAHHPQALPVLKR